MFQNTEFNYSIFYFQNALSANAETFDAFSKIKDKPKIKKTHLFNDRYENIYIDKENIPTLIPILNFANQCAQKILNLKTELNTGYWFNDMPPLSVTIPHTHDDDDELLSGVFYINVPENSGNLILTASKKTKTIIPQEGQLILFKADCLHEVSTNNSQQHRLSIGINFGLNQD